MISYQQNTPLTNEIVKSLEKSNFGKENDPIIIDYQNNSKKEKEKNSIVTSSPSSGLFIIY